MLRRTKIVATISNLQCSPSFIEGLYKAGMNVVRLNTAHMSHDDALEVIRAVRSVSDKIALLLDTKGPEIRTCDMDRPLQMKSGDMLRVTGAPGQRSSPTVLCVSYEHFVRDVPVGSSIMIDDRYIALAVMDKDDESLICSVEKDGVIKDKKSINIPAVHVIVRSAGRS